MISELLGNNEQLLDEVEHDIMNYQCKVQGEIRIQ